MTATPKKPLDDLRERVLAERARIEAERGPRPEAPAWCTQETKTKIWAFVDYLFLVEAQVSEKQWRKVMKFLDQTGVLLKPVEKKVEREIEKAGEYSTREMHGAAVAAGNAFMVSSMDAIMISIAILTGVKPERSH